MINPLINAAIKTAVELERRNERTISVSFGRTINVGDYNSLRLDARVTETIAKDEDYDEAYKKLWNECFGQVERAEKAFNAKQRAKIAARNSKSSIM